MSRSIPRRWFLTALLALALPLAGPAAAASPPSSQRPVVVRVSEGGFHWTDAGIGAASTLGLVLAAAGLGLARRAARGDQR